MLSPAFPGHEAIPNGSPAVEPRVEARSVEESRFYINNGAFDLCILCVTMRNKSKQKIIDRNLAFS